MKGNSKLLFVVFAILTIGAGVWFLMTRSKSPDMAGMDEGESHSDYMLMLNTGIKYKVGSANTLKFMIHGKDGRVIRDFEILHTKIMHVIVVRKDLVSFQHLHPDFDKGSGIFTLTGLNFQADGPYRVFADFTPSGGMSQEHEHHSGMTMGQTLGVFVVAGDENKYQPEKLGENRLGDSVGSYQFKLMSSGSTLERTLTFAITENAKPVKDLQSYLGALGHAVVLSEGNLLYVHAHPDAGETNEPGSVRFTVHFPRPGKYKVFAQFQHRGKVLTASFIIEIK